MKQYYMLTIATIILMLNLSCKDQIAGSYITEDNTPVRRDYGRDYLWTVDTLQIPPEDLFYAGYMWGASPNDVWMTSAAGDLTSNLWHYNGKNWIRDSVPTVFPHAIWGYSSNYILG